MKLKGLIVEQNTQNERIEDAIMDFCNILLEEVEKIMGDKYWCGQDDAKFFIAVDPNDLHMVLDLYTREMWQTIQEKDYPWDHKPGQ